MTDTLPRRALDDDADTEPIKKVTVSESHPFDEPYDRETAKEAARIRDRNERIDRAKEYAEKGRNLNMHGEVRASWAALGMLELAIVAIEDEGPPF